MRGAVLMAARVSTHLPSHAGTIKSGRVANRGERVSCRACQRQIEWAHVELIKYAAELRKNLAPGYVERTYCDAAERNRSLARNLAHYWHLATFENPTYAQ
jgi:hypothetical protein